MRKYSQPTYIMDFYFFIGENPEKMIQFLKKKFKIEMENDLHASDGHCMPLYSGDALFACVIWTRMKKGRRHFARTISHECLHAANMTLHSRGVVPTYENDEPQTYLMSELISEAEKAK